MAQVDQELRVKFGRVLGGLNLTSAWAYMYDGSLPGIGIHADDAQVQINFFITPTDANMWSDDSSNPAGGLVVYKVGPKPEWDFEDYNSVLDNPGIESLVASTGYSNLTVPYIENRAILFDSTYFHRTDSMRFKKVGIYIAWARPSIL